MQNIKSVYVWGVDQIERQRPPTDILSLKSVRLHYLLLPIGRTCGCYCCCWKENERTNETEFFGNTVVLYRCTFICIYDTSHKSYLQMQRTITNTSLSPSLSLSVRVVGRDDLMSITLVRRGKKSLRSASDLREQNKPSSTLVLHFFCRYVAFDQYWFIINSVDEMNISSFARFFFHRRRQTKYEIQSQCEMQSLFYWHRSDIFSRPWREDSRVENETSTSKLDKNKQSKDERKESHDSVTMIYNYLRVCACVFMLS